MINDIFSMITAIYWITTLILFLVGISVIVFPEFWWKTQKSWLEKTGIRAQKTKLWDIVLRRTAIIIILFGIIFLILPFIVFK